MAGTTGGGPMPAGSVMTASFSLDGQPFIVLNAGPVFKFTKAISLVVDCKMQEELNYYWQRLTEGGEERQCAWLKDKSGLSWQIAPKRLIQLMNDPDPVKAGR